MPSSLIDAGRPVARIHLAPDARPVDRHAAAELQLHLEQIAGGAAKLEITTEPPPTAQPAILIGRSAATERLLGQLDWAALKEDGCVVRAVDGQLVLAGGSRAGSLYAVYEFLESALGCRWLTPQCSVIPRRDTITVEGLDIVHTPVFRYRETFFSRVCDADWAARNRVNGSFFPLDEKRGGKWAYAGFVHTFYTLVPPARYFESHPEYFSEVNGHRIGTQGQLCLTNPAVVDLVTQQAREWLQQQPTARVVSISQNDWAGYCTCAGCRAVDEAEGSPSGSLVRFVNQVAERLEGEFPHVLFDTLAYMYTVDPPRHARPRRNVVIRLCHLNTPCDSHPLEACAMNREYLEQLQGWGRISPEVFIWDYFNDFANYFTPYPNLDAMCADIPLYARSGVTGLFCQGDGTPPKGSGELAELKAYLLAKLLWRPETDGRAVIDEFLKLYYGPAAEPIRAYLELIHRPAREGPVHISPYMSVGATAAFLPPAGLVEAERLFDAAAESVKHDDVLVDRVTAARLPLEFVRVKQELRYGINRNRLAATDPSALARAKRFFFGAIAHGAEGLREQSGRAIRDEFAELDGADLVTLKLGRMKVLVAPRFGGRIVSLIDPVTGEDWMYQPHPDDPGYPIAGGYEEYSQSGWRSPGWKEPFVYAVDGPEVRLSAALGEGLVLDRVYRLEKTRQGPRLLIDSTLRNTGYGSTSAQLRMHPELAAGDWERTAVRVWGEDGAAHELGLWRADASAGGSQWLEGAAVPAGRWSLVRGDRQLLIEFPAGEIEKCLPSWDRATGSVRLDMYGRPCRLEPHQAKHVRQVWTPANV